MDLTGRIVAVTGGGTGIGRGIAEGFADQGCVVVIGGRRESPLREVASSYDGPGSISYHTLDVADRGSVTAFFDWVAQTRGAPAILVNSAGINIRDRGLDDTAPEDWERVIAVNLSGAFWCTQAVLPAMKEAEDGLIINISSIAGLRALPMAGIAYSASKFGMSSMGMSSGAALAEHGIRVTNVYPGEVNTPILDQRPNPVPEERKARMVHPPDIAALVTTIATLPARAHVPEITIKPLYQEFL